MAALDFSKPALELLSDMNELQSFYRRVHSTRIVKPQPPDVDFSQSRAVFISTGKKRTAGYSIEILGVSMEADVLVIKALISTPLTTNSLDVVSIVIPSSWPSMASPICTA